MKIWNGFTLVNRGSDGEYRLSNWFFAAVVLVVLTSWAVKLMG